MVFKKLDSKRILQKLIDYLPHLSRAPRFLGSGHKGFKSPRPQQLSFSTSFYVDLYASRNPRPTYTKHLNPYNLTFDELFYPPLFVQVVVKNPNGASSSSNLI